MKTNYVIACWMGARGSEDTRQMVDRAFFVRQQMRYLERVVHNLDQVTVVVARGGDEGAGREVVRVCEQTSLPVKVLFRENAGYSYGSWNHAYEVYGTEFSHYILAEDDYVPVADGFDDRIVKLTDEEGGYVCGLVSSAPVHRWSDVGDHAAVTNGGIRSDDWDAVHPAPIDATDGQYSGPNTQVRWSSAFARTVGISDWIPVYATPFWNGRFLEWFSSPRAQPIFVPVQAIGLGQLTVRIARDHFRATLTERGMLIVER
jgi:hypothetical protein